jgi:hypothetical protein
VVVLLAAALISAPHFRMVELVPPHPYVLLNTEAINASGDVLAICATEDDRQRAGYIWHAGTWKKLPEIREPGYELDGGHIADDGVAVISSSRVTDGAILRVDNHAWVVRGTNVSPIPSRGAEDSVAGVTDGAKGEFLWYNEDEDKLAQHIWKSGASGDRLIVAGSDPHGNRKGHFCFTTYIRTNPNEVVDSYSLITWRRTAKLWKDGVVTEIGEGFAVDINDQDDVIGFSRVGDGKERHMETWLWHADHLTQLSALGSSRPVSINNKGDSVGTVENKDPAKWFGFAYLNGISYNLNSLIKLPTGERIGRALDINDHGEILCTYGLGSGTDDRMAVLTPE